MLFLEILFGDVMFLSWFCCNESVSSAEQLKNTLKFYSWKSILMRISRCAKVWMLRCFLIFTSIVELMDNWRPFLVHLQRWVFNSNYGMLLLEPASNSENKNSLIGYWETYKNDMTFLCFLATKSYTLKKEDEVQASYTLYLDLLNAGWHNLEWEIYILESHN